MTYKPSVSVVMPTFNSKKFVEDSISSVIRQSFLEWELIVIDDASTDGTSEFIKDRFSCEPRVRVIPLQKNGGAAVARNAAIEESSGRYIAFLDSDDLWLPEKLTLQLQSVRSTGAVLSFTSYDVVREGRNKIVRKVTAPTELRYRDLLRGQQIGCLTALYDTSLVGKVYMPNLRMRQDWGLWLRLLASGGSAVGVQESLAILRARRGSLSSNKLKATYYSYQVLRQEAALGRSRAFAGAMCHAFDALKRRSPWWRQ